MKIAIVMLTFNRLEFTKIVIDNYFKTTKVPHKLLVWDNHSSDGSREWLDRVAKKRYPLRVHLSKKNVGEPGGVRGLLAHPSYRDADFIGRIDNDILVCDDWLENFVEAFEKIPNLGIIGAYNEKHPTLSKDGGWEMINGIELYPTRSGIQESLWLARRAIFEEFPFTEHGYAGHWIYFSRLSSKCKIFLAYHRKVHYLTDQRQWDGDSPFPDIDYTEYYKQIAAYRSKKHILPK